MFRWFRRYFRRCFGGVLGGGQVVSSRYLVGVGHSGKHAVRGGGGGWSQTLSDVCCRRDVGVPVGVSVAGRGSAGSCPGAAAAGLLGSDCVGHVRAPPFICHGCALSDVCPCVFACRRVRVFSYGVGVVCGCAYVVYGVVGVCGCVYVCGWYGTVCGVYMYVDGMSRFVVCVCVCCVAVSAAGQ